jgi:prepilin-type N-terminal cleavage/methylation domain-containing protein
MKKNITREVLNTNLNKGFTLVEFLIVIVVVAFLAYFAFAKMNDHSVQSTDSDIEAAMSNIRAESIIYYNTLNNYGTIGAGPSDGACFKPSTLFISDAIIYTELKAARNASGGLFSCINSPGSGGSWAVAVQLKTFPSQALCVDSRRTTKITLTLPENPTQADLDSKISKGACL